MRAYYSSQQECSIDTRAKKKKMRLETMHFKEWGKAKCRDDHIHKSMYGVFGVLHI